MSRIESAHVRAPFSEVSAGVPGEQSISSVTTFPTVITDGFPLSGLDDEDNQLAAPRYLSILVELSGSAADAAEVPWSLCFWHPSVVDANKWRETDAFVAGGVDVRGAAGAALGKSIGNIYVPDCPRGATRAFVHVPDLPADVVLHVIVEPMN